MINLFDDRPKNDPAATSRIKAWVAIAFDLDEESSVSVSELRCSEEDCPDVETVIGIFGVGQTRKYKLMKPLAEVAREDVFALAEAAPVGEIP